MMAWDSRKKRGWNGANQENGLKGMEYDIMCWTGRNGVRSTANVGRGRTR